jgi:hypothetical protein
MLNEAIGGDYHPVTALGPGAGTINAAAFLSKAGWSIVIVSTSATPTDVSIKFPPGGVSPSRSLTLSAPSITSTNETTDDQVRIATGSISEESRTTVPAYGLVVLLPPSGPS